MLRISVTHADFASAAVAIAANIAAGDDDDDCGHETSGSESLSSDDRTDGLNEGWDLTNISSDFPINPEFASSITRCMIVLKSVRHRRWRSGAMT